MDKPNTGSSEDLFVFLAHTVGSATCLGKKGDIMGVRLVAIGNLTAAVYDWIFSLHSYRQ